MTYNIAKHGACVITKKYTYEVIFKKIRECGIIKYHKIGRHIYISLFTCMIHIERRDQK